MVEKFENRLSSWKFKSLSIGDRLTLMNAVLGRLCKESFRKEMMITGAFSTILLTDNLGYLKSLTQR